MGKLLKILKTPLYLFVPSLCVLCGNPVDEEKIICKRCELKFDKYRLKPPICWQCGGEMAGRECLRCKTLKPKFNRVRAPYRYNGEIIEIISLFKYRGLEKIASFMAEEMAESIVDNYDLITYVPLHPVKKRIRGFSQTFLLAKELSKILNLPLKNTLRRKKNTLEQASLPKEKRRENLKGAFEPKEQVKNQKVLLVDDVMTTGVTLNEATKTLIKAGALLVDGIVFAIRD